MPRLSDIEVALTAEDRTSSAFASAQRNLKSLASAAGVVAGGAALVGGALIAAASSAIDFASSVNDAATAAGLSAETFQAMQYTAGLAGVNAEKFSAAMIRANKTIGDAATGNAAAANTFAKLGIGVRDASGEIRSTEDVVRDLADRISQMESPAEKAAAAAALFGKAAGPQLVAMLEQGSDGIDRMIASGKSMGLVMSEELIAKADTAGDTLDTLANVLKTELSGALIELAPQISSVAKELTEAAVAAGKWWAAWRGTDTGQDRLNRLSAEIISTSETIDGLSQAKGLELYMAGGEERAARLRVELKELQADLVRTAQAMGGTPPPERTTGLVEETAAERKARADAERERKRLAREAAAAEKAALRDVADFQGSEQIRSQIATDEYYRNLQQSVDEFSRDAQREQDALLESTYSMVTESSGANVEASLAAFSEIEERGVRAAEVVSDGFERVLFAGFRDGTHGMLDAFRNIMVEIGLELARSKLREALGSLFGAVLGNSSKGGGGFWADVVGAVAGGGSGGGKSSSVGDLKEFATGGSFVVPGSSSGDNVIPIFRANGGETVTVSPKGSGSGGITINQNIDARGSSAGDEAKLKQAAKAGAAEAVATIINMKNRSRF